MATSSVTSPASNREVIPAVLREQWRSIAAEQPQLFPNEIAKQLRVSECKLLASKVGHGVVRLKSDWPRLLARLGTLGRVKSITRNEYAVLEKNGAYPKFEHFGVHSMFVGDEIDLRISLNEWRYAYASVSEGPQAGQLRRSLQFYGKDGSAVHKIFLLAESSVTGYEEILEEFVHEHQHEGETAADASPAAAPATSTFNVDRAAFLGGWSELTDTHEFFQLLHRFRLARADAMRLAEGAYTVKVPGDRARKLLEHVSHAHVPLMIFVGNKGCLQIHKGAIKHVLPKSGWLNVMDKSVELHLREEGIADAWLVEKPTSDGLIRSLELFDERGGDISSFFGVRHEGKKQTAEWQQALDLLRTPA